MLPQTGRRRTEASACPVETQSGGRRGSLRGTDSTGGGGREGRGREGREGGREGTS